MNSVATPVDTLQMIRGEFREMPDLRLTIPQAARLWNMDTLVAKSLLDTLADTGLLERTPEGRYLRLGRG